MTAWVLMPCRALEAFRRRKPGIIGRKRPAFGLNALSGIGGVQTDAAVRMIAKSILGLNALSGIGGVQT